MRRGRLSRVKPPTTPRDESLRPDNAFGVESPGERAELDPLDAIDHRPPIVPSLLGERERHSKHVH